MKRVGTMTATKKKGSAISRRVITTQSKSFRYFWMFDSLDKSILIWHFRVRIFVAESTWWETFLELWKNKKNRWEFNGKNGRKNPLTFGWRVCWFAYAARRRSRWVRQRRWRRRRRLLIISENRQSVIHFIRPDDDIYTHSSQHLHILL